MLHNKAEQNFLIFDVKIVAKVFCSNSLI